MHPQSSDVTIVVVTHNRKDVLRQSLEHLTDLERPYALIVVDNASSDGTPEMLSRDFSQVRLVRMARNRGAVARDFGARLAASRYVAFCDDDAWWHHGALKRACSTFERHPRLGLIQPQILVGPQERPDPCCQRMPYSPLPRPVDLPGFPILGFIGCTVIMRRQAYLRAGGYRHRFGTGGEEALLAIDMARWGWGLVYLPNLCSHHYPSALGRDVPFRQAEGLRNELWTSWLRRSPGDVLRRSLRHLLAAWRDSAERQAIRLALAGLPWVLSQRRPIPADLERQIEALERQDSGC